MDSILIPEGVFEPGQTVSILLYAISTTDSSSGVESGVDGYGWSDMSWLFAWKSGAVVP